MRYSEKLSGGVNVDLLPCWLLLEVTSTSLASSSSVDEEEAIEEPVDALLVLSSLLSGRTSQRECVSLWRRRSQLRRKTFFALIALVGFVVRVCKEMCDRRYKS
eukprot:TRINITY_DN1017_c0_g1_i1.p1 TRINITY_DN1017_c0_g1~~TRINITY_DN1017_c0_g1_i1.p1  ORF type:complete len:104 (+),score=3.16 TRINITY_DN1017_c0_g1_i1:275-586(+)